MDDGKFDVAEDIVPVKKLVEDVINNRLVMSGIIILLTSIIFMLIKPSFIYKQQTNKYNTMRICYFRIFIFSLLVGVIYYYLPIIFNLVRPQ